MSSSNKDQIKSEESKRTRDETLVLWQRELSVLVLSLVALFLLYVLGIYFSDILRILALSVLFSYLFINVVDWLEKYSRNRALSILFVYLILGVMTTIALVIVVPAVIYQITQLVNATFDEIPRWIDSSVKALHPFEQRLHSAQIQVRAIDILSSIATNLPKPDPAQIIARMSEVAMSTMTWLFYALSVIVLSFYFILDGHHIKEAIIAAFPRKRYAQLELLAGDMDRALQSFFRGQIVLGLCFGAVMLVVYIALGVHYALLLAVFLGLLEIVPVIGPTVGIIPTLIAVAIDGMDMVPTNRLAQVIIVTLVFSLIQWVKDNVVAPKYMGNVIGLHPVMIFVAIMIGARLDGVCGIIWSLPVACVINVAISHMTMSRRKANQESAPETNGTAALSSGAGGSEPVSHSLAEHMHVELETSSNGKQSEIAAADKIDQLRAGEAEAGAPELKA